MRDVLFYASERHFVDHLAPIAAALCPDDAAAAGLAAVSIAAGSRDAYQRFQAWGLDPALRRTGVTASTRRRRSSADSRPLVVVASFGDYRRARGIGPVVLVEHGAGQTYVGTDPDLPYYAGGAGRDDVVMFLCPNERVAAANRRRYPATPAVIVGSPRVEALTHTRERAADQRRHPAAAGRPIVAFSTHWDCQIAPESRWAFPHFSPALPHLNDDGNPWRLIGHGHPRAWADLNDWYAQRGIVRVRHFDDVARWAEVYVVDNSSTLYEAVAIGCRVVVLDAPWYRRDVEHGLRFWEWADVGPRVASPADLFDAVTEALTGPDRWAAERVACSFDLYGQVAGSVERAAGAILVAAGA